MAKKPLSLFESMKKEIHKSTWPLYMIGCKTTYKYNSVAFFYNEVYSIDDLIAKMTYSKRVLHPEVSWFKNYFCNFITEIFMAESIREYTTNLCDVHDVSVDIGNYQDCDLMQLCWNVKKTGLDSLNKAASDELNVHLCKDGRNWWEDIANLRLIMKILGFISQKFAMFIEKVYERWLDALIFHVENNKPIYVRNVDFNDKSENLFKSVFFGDLFICVKRTPEHILNELVELPIIFDNDREIEIENRLQSFKKSLDSWNVDIIRNKYQKKNKKKEKHNKTPVQEHGRYIKRKFLNLFSYNLVYYAVILALSCHTSTVFDKRFNDLNVNYSHKMTCFDFSEMLRNFVDKLSKKGLDPFVFFRKMDKLMVRFDYAILNKPKD